MQKTLSLSTLNTLFTIGLFLIALGPLSGTLRFWQGDGLVLSPAGSLISGFGVLLTGVSFVALRKLYRITPSISAEGCLVSFLILFFSDWICRPYNIIRGPEIRGEVFAGAFVVFLFFSRNKLAPLLFWGGFYKIMLMRY